MKPTDILLVIISFACLGAALILMPWSELNFGFDLNAIPAWSHGIVQSPPMSELKGLGEQVQTYLKNNGAESNFGDYMYALVIFGILTLLGLVFMAVGREEAEEKLYLPVKK